MKSMDRKLKRRAQPIAVILLGVLAAAGIPSCQIPNSPPTSGAGVESGSATARAATTSTVTATRTPPPRTATPTITPTPRPPVAAANQNAFCRAGPSQYYVPTGELVAGATSPISGRNEESTWWVIAAAYEGGDCWISDSVVTVSGDASAVEVVAAPPLVPIPPEPFAPIGDKDCDPGLPHTFLKWHPAQHPLGIALYEWELLSRDDLQSGTTIYTEVEVVIECGERYTWHVRSVDNEGTTGPYSELVEFRFK